MMAACHLDTNASSTLLSQGPLCALVPHLRQVAQPFRPSQTTQAGLLACETMCDTTPLETYVKKYRIGNLSVEASLKQVIVTSAV
jgi:hypothetical protein